MMRNSRQGIVVWFKKRKNLKQIKRHGNLIYTSRKLRYAILYVDQLQVSEIEAKLEKLPYIIKVERSYKPFLRTNFENKLPDQAKQYDYNVGI